MEEHWKDNYKEVGYLYGKGPNHFFAQFIDTMPATKLLLPFAGDGRDAVYAAQYGWGVDAFDTDENNIVKAQALADEKFVSINYQKANLSTFEGNEDDYDLIALLHTPLLPVDRELFHRHLLKYLKKGGRLIMEVLLKDQVNTSLGRPLYTIDDIKHDFLDLKIEMLHEIKIKNDPAEGSLEHPAIHFVALKE